MADQPRFRQDLVAEPIEDGGSKFIDVMDPDSGVLFRFYEVEYSLACAMDGQRDVAGIVRWADEELGLKTSANEVKVVISTLGDLGYLEGAARAAIQAPAAAAAVAAAAAPVAPAAAKRSTPAGGVPAATPKQPEASAFNRWDAPTAMGDADEYLAQGVVTGGGGKKAPSGADVELGAPGARSNQPRAQTPQPADLELGAPGATSKSRTPAKGADIALGASGAAAQSTDVSMDLADGFNVGADDVKAAVRASQVMKAVDIPPELAAELEPPKKPAEKAAQPAAKPVEKAVAKPAEKAAQPAAKPVEKAAEKPADKAAKPADKAAKPADKAAKPADKGPTKPADKAPTRPADKPLAPTAPRSGVSPVLIAALVLAILAAGGFAVYKFVLKKSSTTEQTVQTPPPKQPEPPPPPPVESQKLATEQPAPEELKPADARQIAWIAANDTAVKAGDTVAKYVGFKSLEGEALIARALADKAKSDPKADDKVKEAAEKKADDKQAALDKFLLKAPAAGKVTAVAKLNAKVTPTDVVATLQRDAILVATFKKADGATENAAVLLAVKGSDQKLPCNVVVASGDGTKIACPAGAAPDGTEVTYAGVDASRPAGTPGETPAPTPTPDSGSAAPATGSDAAPAEGSADAAGSAATPAAATPKAPRAPVHRPAAHPAQPAHPAPASDKVPAADTPAPAPAPAPAAGSSSL